MKLVGVNGEVMYWMSPDEQWKEKCLEILKEIFLNNPDQFPLIFMTVNPKNGKLQVIPFPFDNTKQKEISFSIMAGILKSLKSSWYCIGTEMYFVSSKKIEQSDDISKPSRCTNREEGLSIIKVEKTGKNESVFFECIRENGKIEYIENKNVKMGQGKLFELFDKYVPEEILNIIAKDLNENE